jgi:hypothetical protein
MARKQKRKIAVIDTETDPFKYGRVPKPFCCEFYCEDTWEQFWGDDCIEQLFRYLEKLPEPYIIYAHNGGKFDFHFMHDGIENPVRIIKSRIVKADLYHHELRDSYAILPVPLRDYEKEIFDYSMMERPRRNKNKTVILKYLHSDCVSLFNLVRDFVDRFGLKLTIGSTAMAQIRKRHEFKRMGAAEDAVMRRFYYGGRVQCFKSGILPGPWKCVDLNSSYPNSMKNYRHPVNGSFLQTDKMPTDFVRPYFVRFIGKNDNALPSVADDGSLQFDKTEGEFFACSHEIQVAQKYGLIQIEKVLECFVAMETISFGQYVDDFFALKLEAEAAGDKALRLFAKLLLNSGYGKFGQNPDNFRDYMIVRDPGIEDQLEEEGYALDTEFPEFELWSRVSDTGDRAFYDVSIAASITSASRAVLLEGLHAAIDPIYCDTDSIICRDFGGDIHPSRLGAWDLEKESQFVAIAGKKLYAMYDDPKGKAKKLASKGGTLELADLLKICKGGVFVHKNYAPSFSTSRKICKTGCEFPNACKCFITRKFKMTVDDQDELA